MRAVFIRAPWVEQAGPDVEVLASVEAKGEPHPVVVRQGRLLATSFHPEVTGDHRVHALFVEMVRDSSTEGMVRDSSTENMVRGGGENDVARDVSA